MSLSGLSLKILLDINPFNLLMAVLFGAGIFAILAGRHYQPKVDLLEIDRIYGGAKPQLTAMQQLQLELDRARFDLSAPEFLRVAVFLGLFGGLAAYLLTGIPVAALFGAALGPAGYWVFLENRATKNMEAYEDELPQVVARLINAASGGAALQTAAEQVAKFGPELCRDDWRYIAVQLGANASRETVFKTLSDKRRSMLLDIILEMLLLSQQKGAELIEILPPLQKSMAERVRTLRKARTKLGEPIRDLQIVAATPFIAVVVFRFLSPTYAEGFASGTGELLVTIGWTVTIVAYLWALKSFSDTMRNATNFQPTLSAKEGRPDFKELQEQAKQKLKEQELEEQAKRQAQDAGRLA
jgi:tight adherence protein B